MFYLWLCGMIISEFCRSAFLRNNADTTVFHERENTHLNVAYETHTIHILTLHCVVGKRTGCRNPDCILSVTLSGEVLEPQLALRFLRVPAAVLLIRIAFLTCVFCFSLVVFQLKEEFQRAANLHRTNGEFDAETFFCSLPWIGL